MAKPRKRKRTPSPTKAAKPTKAKATHTRSKPSKPGSTRAGKPKGKKPALRPHKKPAPASSRSKKPAAPHKKKAAPGKRTLSQTPRARAARKARRQAQAKLDRRNARRRELYAERRGLEQQREGEKREKREKREAERKGLIDEVSVAREWLERIRNDVAHVFPCSLEVTEPGGGRADMDPDAPATQRAETTPWLVVGRFDPQDEIGYAELAEALSVVDDDHLLMAWQLRPSDRRSRCGQMFSQIRIVWSDPNEQASSRRGAADMVLSRVGSFEFVVSDIINEIVGTGPTDEGDPDPQSLAGRYKDTTVPQFYVFFSGEVAQYESASPWAKTQTIKIRK